MANNNIQDTGGFDDDDDELFAQLIQETDYYNGLGPGNSDYTTNQNDVFMSEPVSEVVDHVAAHQHTTSELRQEVATLQYHLENTVQLNTDLKNKNYELQGEAGTLRRRLDQFNATKQQLILDKIQSVQDTKQKETEVRREFMQEIEALKSQLRHAQIELKNAEERNNMIIKRQSLGKSFSNPAIGTSPNTTQRMTPRSPTALSLPLAQAASQSTKFSFQSKHDKYSVLNRTSFFAKEVDSQVPYTTSIPIELESKEVQTDAEEATITQTSLQLVSDSTTELYVQTKAAIRRLISVEIQMVKPIIEKTLQHAHSAFKHRVKSRQAGFGPGFDAFDATTLMLQMMDEQEIREKAIEESHDMQEEYLRRLNDIYDKSKIESLPIPVTSNDTESQSQKWSESEPFIDSSEDEDNVETQDPTTTQTAANTVALPQSLLISDENSRDTDTSEDEYEVLNRYTRLNSKSVQVDVPTVSMTDFEIVATGIPHLTQTKRERKLLTFFKEYKLKSKLLSDRNCCKYIKEGQPLQVVLEILDGLYEEGAGIWNTLYFIKIELQFLLRAGNLFEPNRLQVFFTLIVWAKNLWSVIAVAEEEEKPKLQKRWDLELFGWTELMLEVVWRPSRNLVAFCRELRSTFLGTITQIIESGYFEGNDREDYRRLFLTIHDSIKNPIHHNLLNAQYILDIAVFLPSPHILPFFCNKTVPVAIEIELPKCFLLVLSNRIKDEFQINPSLALFESYLDLLQKLLNPETEVYVLPSKFKTLKRKLSDNDNEEFSEDSMASIAQLAPPNIFKDTEKCICGVSVVNNFLLIVSKAFGLWRETFRNMEFNGTLENSTYQTNIYTDVLVRAFEFIYTLYKHSDNLIASYSSEVSTYFWSIVGSYRRFSQYFPLRPDMDAMLKHMTNDGEEKRKTGDDRITFPPSLDQEWIEMITKFPQLNRVSNR